MNNFSYTTLKPNIDMGEVSSVRDMIFAKARERSLQMASNSNEQMSQNVQNETMNSARASISSSRAKPFSLVMKPTEPKVEKKEDVTAEQNNMPEQILKEQPILKHEISSVNSSSYTYSAREDVMNATRNQFNNKPTLKDSLRFLNQQAAIKMVNKTHSKIV